MLDNFEQSAFDNFDELSISGKVTSDFIKISRWAKTLGILGFLLFAIALILGLLAIIETMAHNSNYASSDDFIIGFMICCASILILFLSLKIFKFGRKLESALKSKSNSDFEHALLNLKIFFGLTALIVFILILFVGLILFAATLAD